VDGDLAPWEPARVAVGLLAQGGSSHLKMPGAGPCTESCCNAQLLPACLPD
jgi:hypothetical protein